MRFCETCDNILIPRAKKLYCAACDVEIDLEKTDSVEYNIIKMIRHDDKEVAPIIIKGGMKTMRISDQDRKAHEDLFGGTSESGY